MQLAKKTGRGGRGEEEEEEEEEAGNDAGEREIDHRKNETAIRK